MVILNGIIIILIFTCKFISPAVSTPSGDVLSSTEEIENKDKQLLEKYNLETDSDIIFIKCPLTNYSEYQNYTLFSNQNDNTFQIFEDSSKKFNWYLIERKKHMNASNYYCKQDNGLLVKNEFEWIIEINWKKAKQNVEKKIFINKNILTKLCNVSNVIQIFYINIKGALTEGCPNLNQFYKSQLLYMFNFTEKEESKYLVPYKILNFYFKAPNIIIEGEVKLNNQNSIKFFFVKKDFETKRFNVKLKTDNEFSNFYHNENVIFSVGKYDVNKKLIFSKMKKLMNNSFDIVGYGIYQLGYICDKCQEGDNVTVKKTYYFGPKKTIVNKIINNVNNEDLSYKANCSRNLYKFAYLEKASFNGIHVDIKNNSKLVSKDLQQFSINSSHLTIAKNNPRGILKCYYKTPTSYIIKNENFNVISKMGRKDLKHDDKNSVIKKVSQLNKNPKTSKSSNSTLIYICCLIGVMLLIILIICYIKKDSIKNSIKRRKMMKKYPNIYNWWNILKNSQPNEYGKVIVNTNFFENQIKNYGIRQVTFGGDTIKQLNETNVEYKLVKSQNNLPYIIMASHIELKDIKSKFIISNYPYEENFPHFWRMIYEEGITSVVAIIHENVHSKIKDFKYYFKIEKASYDNCEINLLKVKNTIFPTINVIEYSISMNNKNPKIVNIYHVYDWMENSLLETNIEIDKLYKHIIDNNSKPTILVHSHVSPCSRVYSFIYFGTVLETMEKNKKISSPMVVINEIREQRNGGYISIQDYSVIMFNLVNYWVEKELLVIKHYYTKYVQEYSKYRFDERRSEAIFSGNCRPFVCFAIQLSRNSIYEMLHQSQYIYKLDSKTIKTKCRRFYQIQKNSLLNFKNRFPDIPCYDFKSINYDTVQNPTDDINNYYHGNIIEYKTTSGMKRSIIMCQVKTKFAY
uniref:Tyrosine-protein phosphatase domain-containing protein n=1 Tax=Strongyloides papillosus TaxID=174720 RepID=A0A0N5BV69_STREA